MNISSHRGSLPAAFSGHARGFTLIELLVVISIIGMLSSIILVALQNARQKGKDGAIIEETLQLRELFETEKGTNYSTTFKALPSDVLTSGSQTYQYTFDTQAQCAQVADSNFSQLCSAILTNDTDAAASLIVGGPIADKGFYTKYSIVALLPSTKTYVCYGSSGQNAEGVVLSSGSDDYTNPNQGCLLNP